MYMPKEFAENDPARLHELVRRFSFAMVVTATDDGPMITHIPLFLDTGSGTGEHGRLLGHVAKSNPHWQSFDGVRPAVCVFQGPHAYISPNWYESERAVPTWNYAVVHAHGRPRNIDDPAAATEVLKHLIGTYETEATGNWSMAGLPEKFIGAQLKAIQAFEMPIERLAGKFKMSQNRKSADALGAAAGLKETGDPVAEEVAEIVAAGVAARDA